MNRSAFARAVASFAGFLVLAASSASQAQQSYKTPKDLPQFIARLPKFCYAQYVDQKLWENPEYSIIKACGIGMNHFCPGLLNIMRAESSIPVKFQMNGKTHQTNRQYELFQAKDNVQYTLKRMPPDCIYRDSVYLAKQRVDLLEKIVR